MALDVAVLVSAGRHPASGRPRRAAADARAVEMGMRLAGSGLRAIHAGAATSPALRDYLGMGLQRLTVLDVPPDADALPALIDHLGERPPDIVLAGVRAESGEDSGMVPYAIAEALGYALVPGIVDFAIEAGRGRFLQALPRGRRRQVSAPLPLVATVDPAAPAPRQSAFARARRGEIKVAPAPLVDDEARRGWQEGPARKRPRRLRTVGGGTAAERIRAAAEMAVGEGRLLVEPDAEVAARAIYDYLVAEGILSERILTVPAFPRRT